MNRRYLTVFMEAAFASAERGGRLALVLFDVDHLKRLNDSHGYLAGDGVLRVFACLLAQETRRSDLTARLALK